MTLYCLFVFQDVISPAPVIVVEMKNEKRRFQIFVENKALLSEPEKKISLGLEAWFSAFWSFSLQYPAGLNKTLLFIEHYILNYGKTKIPASIKTWKEKLFS